MKVAYCDFDFFKCLIRIDARIVNESPLRVGSKSEVRPGSIDLAVERDPRNKVYIPGSSVKGALRALAESLARSMGLPVCNPLSEEDKVREEKGPCVVCGIFGGGGKKRNRVASHIIVYDSYPEIEDVKTYTRTRVAIDRFSLTARQGALFTYEYVPPGITWKLRIDVHNIDILSGSENDRIRVLRALLKYVKEFGLQIGSMKSVGLGLLRLVGGTITRFEVRDFKVEPVFSEDLVKVVESW